MKKGTIIISVLLGLILIILVYIVFILQQNNSTNNKINSIGKDSSDLDSSQFEYEAGSSEGVDNEGNSEKEEQKNLPEVTYSTDKISSDVLIRFAKGIAFKCDENEYTSAFIYSTYIKSGMSHDYEIKEAVANIPFIKNDLDIICQAIRNTGGDKGFLIDNICSLGVSIPDAKIMAQFILDNYQPS